MRCSDQLTRCTRSRENMWILQVTVDSVQMMVERMLRPHALNRRSCKEWSSHKESQPSSSYFYLWQKRHIPPTFSWCLTEWQSAFKYRTSVSSASMEQGWVGAQHTHRPFSIYTHTHMQWINTKHLSAHLNTFQTIPGTSSPGVWNKEDVSATGGEKDDAALAYLAGEHGLDHLCVLTGEHWASQAEDHTHRRQQHEQGHLRRQLGDDAGFRAGY